MQAVTPYHCWEIAACRLDAIDARIDRVHGLLVRLENSRPELDDAVREHAWHRRWGRLLGIKAELKADRAAAAEALDAHRGYRFERWV